MPTPSINLKRSQPTSNTEDALGIAIERIAEQIGEMQQALTRGMPPGYHFEIRDTGLVIVDEFNNREGVVTWITT